MRVREHLNRRALFHHKSHVEHRNAVTNAFCHRKRMRDEDHRHTKIAVDLAQQVQNAHRGARIKGACSLVAQHDARVVRQRARNGDALLLAAGKFAGITLRLVGQAHNVQKLERTFTRSLFALAAQLERKRHVRKHRPLLEQAEALEDHAYAAAQLAQLLPLIVGHVDAVDYHAAARRPLKQVYAAHERRLACTRLANDAEYIAVGNGEAHIMQRMM